MIQLRKENPLVVWGEYELQETEDQVFSYIRSYNGEKWLVVANLSDTTQAFSKEETIKKVMIENMEIPKSLQDISLKPWQAFVVEI